MVLNEVLHLETFLIKFQYCMHHDYVIGIDIINLDGRKERNLQQVNKISAIKILTSFGFNISLFSHLDLLQLPFFLHAILGSSLLINDSVTLLSLLTDLDTDIRNKYCIYIYTYVYTEHVCIHT